MFSQMLFSMRETHNFHRLFKVVSLLVGICLFLAVYYGIHLTLSSTSSDGSIVHRRVYSADDYIQVFIATEGSQQDGTVALVNSIIQNTHKPVHFYFTTDLKSAEQLRLSIENSPLREISYEIKTFALDDPLFTNFTLHSGVETEEKRISYSKMYISDLFPNIKNRLICLEDDMIVQGDIAHLWNISMEPFHIGAFSKDCDTVSKHQNKGLVKYRDYLNLQNSNLKHISVDGEDCVFNLGVMVLNMSLWKNENIAHQLKQWYNLSKKEDVFHVHSILSPFLVVLNNKTALLDNSWHVRHLGVTLGSRYSRPFLKKANLLHWDGRFKPWKNRSPYADLWQKYSIKNSQKV